MTLAVDKIKKKVSLNLADGSQLAGHFFLSPYTEMGVGQETLIQALTAGGRFIPFESTKGEYNFINPKQIVWVANIPEETSEEESLPVPLQRRRVGVFLRDGKIFRGELIMAMPQEKSRLSDWLNEFKDYLVLREETREILINVDYVVRVL
ncbi:MAG: hypothetical protein AB1641_21055 [Thermodesulfobacteriota bacterium]